MRTQRKYSGLLGKFIDLFLDCGQNSGMTDSPFYQSIENFKGQAEGLFRDPGARLVKRFACEAKADGAGPVEFIISTSSVDRDNDTIDPKGWVLDNYRKNGVVLWAHDSTLPPIGKAVGVWVEGNALKAKVEFTPDDIDHPLGKSFGSNVRKLYEQGFMSAVSVGFSPVEWSFNEERGSYAVDFKRQELLEFSAVPVPANPEALVQLAKSTDPKILRDWSEGYMERFGPDGFGLSTDVKALRDAAKKEIRPRTTKEVVSEQNREVIEVMNGLIKVVANLGKKVDGLYSRISEQETSSAIETSQENQFDAEIVREITHRSIKEATAVALQRVTGRLAN